jgi:hypothetical protein
MGFMENKFGSCVDGSYIETCVCQFTCLHQWCLVAWYAGHRNVVDIELTQTVQFCTCFGWARICSIFTWIYVNIGRLFVLRNSSWEHDLGDRAVCMSLVGSVPKNIWPGGAQPTHSRLTGNVCRLCANRLMVGCNSKSSLQFLPKGFFSCVGRVIKKLTPPWQER